jgi:hypothetical protein
MLFFFFWYLLLIILSFIIFKPVLLSLVFIISLPLSGLFAFYYYKHVKKLMADLRWMRIKHGKRELFVEISGLRDKIILIIKELIAK